MFDLAIKNGGIVDGTGFPEYLNALGSKFPLGMNVALAGRVVRNRKAAATRAVS